MQQKNKLETVQCKKPRKWNVIKDLFLNDLSKSQVFVAHSFWVICRCFTHLCRALNGGTILLVHRFGTGNQQKHLEFNFSLKAFFFTYSALLHQVSYVLGPVGSIDRSPVPSPSQTRVPSEGRQPPAPNFTTWRPEGPELRADRRMYSPRILPGGCNSDNDSEEPTASHICQARTAADFGHGKVLVRRWHVQASTTSLQTARNHQRLC